MNTLRYAKAEDVDGFVAYGQNPLKVVAQVFKHYVLYVSLNLCSLGSQVKTSPHAARKSYKEGICAR